MQVAVTGISSYLARSLFPLLESDPGVGKIVGLDVKPPALKSDKLDFVECDIRHPHLKNHLEGCDALIHLAFIVMPIHDEVLTDDININGSKNVFLAAAAAGVRKLVHLSSVASYGAWPDNPDVIHEDVPVRGMPDFYYSRAKAELETYLDEFEKRNPEMVITRLRPCIFIGPTIDNAIRDIVQTKIFPKNSEKTRLQLVWDEDVAHAIHIALKGDYHGAYNLAGDGYLTNERMAEILGARQIYVPYKFQYWFIKLLWGLRLVKISPGWVDVARYPIVVSTEKAKKELGWQPTYDTEGAFRKLVSELREV